MALNLGSIFGTQINVVVQPRDVERNYSGFPGAHGVTSMLMGSRGRRLQIAGRIVASGANYDAARVACQIAIDSIEPYLWSAAHDYYWGSNYYYSVVFERFLLVGDRNGKFFSWNAPGYVVANFVCLGRTLI